MSRHGFHTFSEPRLEWDTPLADRPDWDEIERAAEAIRNRPIAANRDDLSELYLMGQAS